MSSSRATSTRCPPSFLLISYLSTPIHFLKRARNASRRRDVQASSRCLPACDRDIRPGPTRTTSTATLNQNIRSTRTNRTLHIIQHKVANCHTIGWLTFSSVVCLIDDDAIVGDTGKGNARISHAGHGAGVAGDGLDAHAILGVLDFGVLEEHSFDCVVAASTD